MPFIDKLIWQLEQHLTRPISTVQLADLCSVSPYHMNRAFRVATGLAPMAYLRARRLSVAAKALAYGDDNILTIALEAQYASHEAFTRAFSAAFNQSPRALRQMASTKTLTLKEPILMTMDQLIDLAPPKIEDRPAMTVAGYSIPCSQGEIAGIPALWERFNRVAGDPALDHSAAYGVCYNMGEDGTFDYMAGCQLAGSDVPHGMTRTDIPAGRYAVFTHAGHVSDMPRMFNTIWNKAIPESGLTPRAAPEYEIYDERFDGQTERGTYSVAIPVE